MWGPLEAVHAGGGQGRIHALPLLWCRSARVLRAWLIVGFNYSAEDLVLRAPPTFQGLLENPSHLSRLSAIKSLVGDGSTSNLLRFVSKTSQGS